MKKPDRKAFTREYGPRGAAKYAKAMQKYRKSLKAKPTAPPPPPKKKSPPAPPPAPPKAPPPAPKKDKPAQPSTPAVKQTTKEQAAARFYSSSSQGSIAKNQEKAKSNFFRSSSGTRGKLRPSNPASPTVRRKGSTTGASVDPRERSLRKNRADARRSNRRRLKMNRRGRRVR